MRQLMAAHVRRYHLFIVVTAWLLSVAASRADDETSAADKRDDSPAVDASGVEEVFQRVKPSLAVISVRGRDGKLRGLGSGFVVAADGLIATNMHVIGEGRAIEVQLADGKHYDVKGVHAFDRHRDLAVLRVEAKDLKPLPIGDSEALRQGQTVVALGNPQGLRHSVVTGVVSGRREIDGRSMIQLAIPVEPGNSGGPLVDLQGRVGGIITMKSAVTANLGFAVAVNDLKPLLTKPNPVPIARWINQGQVDPRQWQVLQGASWRTRGSRILVDGEGDGFGGRPLPFDDGAARIAIRNERLGAIGRRSRRGRPGLRGRRRR
jgi:S1-C subfamily serine protease